VISGDHDLARLKRLADRAARVGEDDGSAPGRRGNSHRVGDGRRVAVLVEMRPANERQHPTAMHLERTDPTGVTGDAGRGEPR
jgi:hypothetical protein